MSDIPIPAERRSFRLPAPAADAMIRWPDVFGRRFLLTIDTEEEFDWSRPLSRDHRAVTATAAIPAAHRRLRDGGAAPQYMVDHPVATDPAAIVALQEATNGDAAAIGAQLHAWVTPPHDERVGSAESFAGNLPRGLERAKIATITQAIADAFGSPPRAFRSGRYGLGPHSFDLLEAFGYRLDCSARSRFDYHIEGGPDYRHLSGAAFRAGRLTEVPLTTVFTGLLRRRGPDVFGALSRVPRGLGLFARAGLIARVPLTPEGVGASLAIRAVDAALADGARLLHFAFHSPSLVAGHTPYVRDAVDLARFWRWWDRVLAHLARCGVSAVSLSGIEAGLGPEGRATA